MRTKQPTENMKPQIPTVPDAANLTLLSDPANLLDIVRRDKTALLATKQLTTFYVMCDVVEKGIKKLKDRCRIVILGRRNEGTPTGDKSQHREFRYTTSRGDITLVVQERIPETPDPQKLEALLKGKDLWEMAQTTALDLNKVDGMRQAGMITSEEFASVCNEAKPIYALIAKFDPSKGGEA